MAELRPGARFGPYAIGRQIGAGGMGIVYRAKRGSELLALKVMRAELRDQPSYVRRFSREVRLAAALDHPNLVHVIDGGELDGTLFVATHYCNSGSLLDRLREGPMGLDDAVRMLRHVAGALDHLHEQGFVHRDVKPGNIMFDKQGRAYLGDFGLARGEAFTVLTKPGEVMGTVAYIAPELLRGRRAGPSSDIYALACTAFQALTGRVPYPATDAVQSVRAHLQSPPPDPRDLRPDLPDAIGFVLGKALAKDAADRPKTAVGFATSVAVAARA